MRLVSRFFILIGLLLFAVGCVPAMVPALPPATIGPEALPLSTMALAALPATSTPERVTAVTAGALSQASPVVKFATDLPDPTATFAAYGLTQTLGTSVEKRPVLAYRFGYGADTVVFVGGIHGGYEWNTIALAYEAIDYFQENPQLIPANVSLYIIPSANPDGQFIGTGTQGRLDPDETYEDTTPGRFNAHEVDLNRNWDCEWSATARWGNKQVSGGDAPFSEPEVQLLRRFFWRERPELVVFWHSKADGIFAAGCPETYGPSLAAAEIYAAAAGYPIYEDFTAYPVTGDASNWLAAENIASFTVELKTYTGTDWEENKAGMEEILSYYGRSP